MDLTFSAAAIAAMRDALPTVSDEVVQGVVAEVPSYSRAFAGSMGDTIRGAVGMALSGFLDRLDPEVTEVDRSAPAVVRQGAYELGRGEARSGRSMDALLSAYRVGARIAWRELSGPAVATGLSANRVVLFAEQVFAYIDELSADSLAGHSDELETTGRVRQRLLERLTGLLLEGASADVVLAAARRAEWEPSQTLTAVLLPSARLRAATVALGSAGARSLVAADNADLGTRGNLSVLLVPDASRGVLRRVLRDDRAVIGSTVEWLHAGDSYRRALRAHGVLPKREHTIDTDEHLVELVRRADPAALTDLRARVLAPLDGQRPATRAKLEETLRAWLLCQGRREAAAEMLFIHPQTVRYRMGQLRELFGDSLTDPIAVLEFVVALGRPTPTHP